MSKDRPGGMDNKPGSNKGPQPDTTSMSRVAAVASGNVDTGSPSGPKGAKGDKGGGTK